MSINRQLPKIQQHPGNTAPSSPGTILLTKCRAAECRDTRPPFSPVWLQKSPTSADGWLYQSTSH